MTLDTSVSGGGGAGNNLAEVNKPKDARRHFRRNPRKPSGTPRVVVKQPKFEGTKNDNLKGHIFNCSDARQLDLFTKTTKEIGDHMGSSFKYGSDAQLAIENLSVATLVGPDNRREHGTEPQVRKKHGHIHQEQIVPHGESQDIVFPSVGTMHRHHATEGRSVGWKSYSA